MKGGLPLSLPSALFRTPSSMTPPGGHQEHPDLPEKLRVQYLLFAVLFTFVTGLFFNTPQEILEGLYAIHRSPSILLSDYMEVGNIGAALVNSSLLMLLSMALAKRARVTVSGPFIAAIFTIGGFALFGKNLYNSLPIMAGVLIHAKYRKEPFGKFILPALFGTALGPVVSQLSFGLALPLPLSIPLGILAGLLAGFMLPSLANQFIRFHQGYNLYNIGFTSGIIGMLFMSLVRGFAKDNPPTAILLKEESLGLLLYLLMLFGSMVVFGLKTGVHHKDSLLKLFRRPGQLVSDFVASDGFPVTSLNMGLLGLLTTGYVFLVGGSLNGPIIGGIFTVVGFGAFGKHVKNVLPIMVGILLANAVFQWEVSSIGSLLAALFATTLAPIAGAYGIIPGLLAGFLHMAVVMNVGYLHGGMNLYNNGFSGGFVAAILVPVLDSLNVGARKWEEGK